MSELDLDNTGDKSAESQTETNTAIASVVMDVIEQVEHEKIVKPTCKNEGTGIENYPTFKSLNSTLNSSKSSNSFVDKSKHRSGNKKVRVRRHRKRKWKPYCKLTWEERKKLEERDSRRAYRTRERMSASGLTLAPYNTTQFLMEDHNLQEPDYENIHHKFHKDDSHSYDSEEDFYSSPSDEEEFLHQQFSEAYDSYHDAYLKSRSKFELISEMMRLEDEIERAEQSLKESRERKSEYPGFNAEAELAKIQVFQNEIEKLTHENIVLEKQNEIIQNHISMLKTV